jgi:hypothetical protein
MQQKACLGVYTQWHQEIGGGLWVRDNILHRFAASR